MGVLLIETNDKILRVRKEDCGCVFFFDGLYVEGNEITFKIMEAIAEHKTMDKVVPLLLDKYNVKKERLISDLITLFKSFEKYNVFNDYITELDDMKGVK